MKALACRPGSHLDCHANMSSEEEQNTLLEVIGLRPGCVLIHPWGMFGNTKGQKLSRTTYDTLDAGRTPDIFGQGQGHGFPGAADSDNSLVVIRIVYEVSDIV